ncbi:hypothetical protein HDU96_002368 [Phlyctochytrium bullatum]|nr:hypothetical protein HDU96_002368 [Phlyctochytrium bullatum]
MESAIAEREMEIHRLKEVLQHASNKIKDPRLKSELAKAKADVALLEKENIALQNSVSSLRGEKAAHEIAYAELAKEKTGLMEELLRKEQQIQKLQVTAISFQEV